LSRQRPAKAKGGRSPSPVIANQTSSAGLRPFASRKLVAGRRHRLDRADSFHRPTLFSLSSRALFHASGLSGLPVFAETLGVRKPQWAVTSSRSPSGVSRTIGASYFGQIAGRGSALPSKSRSAETAKSCRIRSGGSVLAYKLHKRQVSPSM